MNQHVKSDLNLVYISLLLVGIFIAFNFHDANATSTTIIHNYAATTGRECFGPANGGSNAICAEPFPNLPVGHRVTGLGFQGSGTYFSSQATMYLYDSDGVLWHQKQTVTHTGSSLASQFFYFAEKVTVPANVPIINLGYSVTGSNHPFSSIAVYDDQGGAPHNQLANISYIVGTGVSTIPMPSVVNTPANGIVWLVLQEGSGTFDGLDNGASNISDALVVQSFLNCTLGPGNTCPYPNPWTGGIATTKAPYISITVGDYSIPGMAGTKLNGTGFQNGGSGIHTTAPTNSTFIKSSTLWLAITSSSGTGNEQFVENSTGISGTKVLEVPASPFFATTFGTPINEVNYTSAPYMQLTYSNTDLKLSPTSGNVGSSVTATGANFTAASVSQTIKKNNETSFQGWDGHVFLQKFTGLTSSGKVTGVGYFANTPHGNVRVKVYDDNGIFQHQANQTHVLNSAADNEQNTLYAEQFTGLPAGKTISSVWTWVQSGALGGTYSGAVYDDLAGVPNNLLGSGSTGSFNGKLQISLNAKIPSNGIVWVALNTNDAGAKVFDNAVSQVAGTSYFHAQTCCSVPNPFGAGSSRAFGPYMVVQYNDVNNTGAPLNLLGESGSTTVQIGKRSVPVTATIPADGNVWAGFEFDDTSNNLYFNQTGVISGTTVLQTHVFGAGPSVFSLTNFTQNLWTSLNTTGSDPVTLKWDGSTLTTNPTIVQADQNGAFSGVTFTVPSATGGSHRVNASDTGGNWAIASYSVNTPYSVQLRPMLHDNNTLLTSGKLIVTQNGVTIGTSNTNNTGWTSVSSLSGGNYNFTIMDDKNFVVYKAINYNVQSNVVKNVATNDYPFNCISGGTGYQSNFVIRINDTDGTHITNITTPTCPNQSQLMFNMTFTGNGQSSSIYNSLMITTVGTQTYSANPQNFTVSGTLVPTVFTQGNNILSNAFSIGSGTATTTKVFVITLTKTQSTNPGTGGGGPPTFGPIPSNPCPANYVFDNISQQCVIINIQHLPPPSTVCDPNHVAQGFLDINGVCTAPTDIINVPIDCGGPNVTIVSVVVPPNAGYEPILTPPFTYQCPSNSTNVQIIPPPPSTCPLGETLQNDGSCAFIIPPPPNTCPSDLLSCLLVTPPPNQLQVTAEKADGSTAVITTSLPSLQSPQLTSLAWLIIFVILFAVIGGYIYRKYLQNSQKKGKTKSSSKKNPTSGSIEKYNRNLAKEFKKK